MTRKRYTGEPILTRGDYGERVDYVHSLRWSPEEGGWVECNWDERDALGVWDSTFGWIRISREEDFEGWLEDE